LFQDQTLLIVSAYGKDAIVLILSGNDGGNRGGNIASNRVECGIIK
jgi:hypothetical protein